MSDWAKFTPQIIGDRYATALIELRKCSTCGRFMVRSTAGPFPTYYEVDLPAQLHRAGIAIASKVEVDGDKICTDCALAGKATILCVLCEQRRPSDQKKNAYGDPPEFLCLPCYRTVSAEKWDEAEEKLRERHRYDYE